MIHTETISHEAEKDVASEELFTFQSPTERKVKKKSKKKKSAFVHSPDRRKQRSFYFQSKPPVCSSSVERVAATFRRKQTGFNEQVGSHIWSTSAFI